MAWNLGNTTVRNPRRIQAGLQVMSKGFNGNLDGHELESMFAHRLVDEGVVETEKSEYASMDWHGRKWRSCFAKLGFITGNKFYTLNDNKVLISDLSSTELGQNIKPYQITPAGNRLVNATSDSAINDIFLRQLVKLEVKSPIEKESKDIQIKPFILLLQFLNELEIQGQPGLNRIEIAAFLQTAQDHSDIMERVKNIIDYRNKRDTIVGKVKKRKFDYETASIQKDLSGLKMKTDSLSDYADTTFRYSRMSGLLSLKGSRLELRDETRILTNKILETEPVFVAHENPLDYLVDFYKGTTIPTDDNSIALEEIKVFEERLIERGVDPIVNSVDLIGKDSQDLAIAKNELEDQYKLSSESIFAHDHAYNQESIEDVLNYLRKLNNASGIDLTIEDKPAYFEWSVWRALLLFNSLAISPDKTRQFNIDADLHPTGCAPSGRPDIIMEYNDFITVAEVTLKGGSRQEAAEGEPVRRHVAKVRSEGQGKEVYCLFIAPTIDDNTAETFRTGIWYENREPVFINIVPLTLHQFINIIESLLYKKFPIIEVKSVLDRCLMFRNAYAPQWLSHIDDEINDWVSKVRNN